MCERVSGSALVRNPKQTRDVSLALKRSGGVLQPGELTRMDDYLKDGAASANDISEPWRLNDAATL